MCVGFAARDPVRDPEKDKVNIKAVDGLTVGGFSFAIAPGVLLRGCFCVLLWRLFCDSVSRFCRWWYKYPSKQEKPQKRQYKAPERMPKTAEILSGCPDSLKTAQN